MSARADLRRAAPWLLCAVALGMLGLSSWLRWLLPDVGPVEHGGPLETTISALGFAGIPVVGALIASRLPANPIGWLWCAAGLAYAMSEIARPLVRMADAPLWVAWVPEVWGFVSLLGLFVFMFLLFPTGMLPSPAWRWVARAAVTVSLTLALVGPFSYDPAEPATAAPWVIRGEAGRTLAETAEVGIFAMFALVLAGMSSLVLRFRRATPVERRQLTWFLYATAVNGALLVLDAVGLVWDGLVYTTLSAAAFALLPVAVGIAVFRYRLYEIDRIVSRTVSYGLLTGGLAALYLGLVTVLRPLLEPVAGSSALAVAASTLAVAAAFHPARRRLQTLVDRRFDRARYDAGRAVDAFAARLRDQVDLDDLTDGLCATVSDTVAPTRVAVWLRVPSRAGGGRA